MVCVETVEKALLNLPREFECEKIDERMWAILTPFEYPDGDLIYVYVIQKNGVFELTDLAETIRLLKTLDFDIFASKRRQRLFEDILREFNARYFKGEIKTVASPEDLANAILRLSQAIFRISDLYFSQRVGAYTTFREEVEEILKETGVNYEINYRVFGRSGKEYKVDFYVEIIPKPDLVATLSTYSRDYAERLIDRVVRMWYDIRRLDGRFNYVTIIDDRSDVWKKEHFDILEDLSETYVWSRIEEYIDRIKH